MPIPDFNNPIVNLDMKVENLPGIFGGVLTFSCEFDFRPDGGELTRGPLAEEVSEATAGAWSARSPMAASSSMATRLRSGPLHQPRTPRLHQQ